MTSGASLIFALLVLLLPISALAARRLPVRTWLPMAGAWIAIFAVGWLIVSYFT